MEERRGQEGGEAALHSRNVSASELMSFLKGAHYPMGKWALIDLARQNCAPENVIDDLEQFSSATFGSVTEVEKEFSRIIEETKHPTQVNTESCRFQT